MHTAQHSLSPRTVGIYSERNLLILSLLDVGSIFEGWKLIKINAVQGLQMLLAFPETVKKLPTATLPLALQPASHDTWTTVTSW